MTSPIFDLSGKVAAITGGSRGLGFEMAKAFASAGAKVVIASRKLDQCESAAKEIEAAGGTVELIPAIVHRPKFVKKGQQPKPS